MLNALIDSVLPSLVTASLLTNAETYTASFSAEVRNVVASTLRDSRTLLGLVEKRGGDGSPNLAVDGGRKQAITEATGRVWELCDELVWLGTKGLGGFVARKAEMWLGLIRDAVEEIEEWDPEDDEHEDGGGGLLGGDEEEEDDDDDDDDDHDQTGEEENNKVDMTEAKTGALKVLSRIPQSIHVIVKQRLHKGFPQTHNLSNGQRETVTVALGVVKSISECVDEVAEALYTSDIELCRVKVEEARMLTIQLVEAVLKPWDASPSAIETREDVSVKRALDWIRPVELKGGNDKTEMGWTGNAHGTKGER